MKPSNISKFFPSWLWCLPFLWIKDEKHQITSKTAWYTTTYTTTINVVSDFTCTIFQRAWNMLRRTHSIPRHFYVKSKEIFFANCAKLKHEVKLNSENYGIRCTIICWTDDEWSLRNWILKIWLISNLQRRWTEGHIWVMGETWMMPKRMVFQRCSLNRACTEIKLYYLKIVCAKLTTITTSANNFYVIEQTEQIVVVVCCSLPSLYNTHRQHRKHRKQPTTLYLDFV